MHVTGQRHLESYKSHIYAKTFGFELNKLIKYKKLQ